MSKRRISKTSTTTTTASLELPTPLRRSLRLLRRNPQDSTSENQKPSINCKKSDRISVVCVIPVQATRRSPRLSCKVEAVSSLRKSSRISSIGKNNSAITVKRDGDQASKKKPTSHLPNKSRAVSNRVKGERDPDLSASKESSLVEVVIGIKAPQRPNAIEPSKDIKIGGKRKRKRKREEEGVDGSVKGWTKEQEMALQRACIVAKPTPNYWKKVAKQVPGKSAQDCFDKVNSDHITPPQPMPRSRAKRLNSSPLGCFSISTGKLLGFSHCEGKKLAHNKLKSRITHKAVRQLLQKHNHMDQKREADLFSILEPNINPSIPNSHLNDALTPKKLQEKCGFLQKCQERSNSSQKKPISRFQSTCGTDIVSPPVLKRVKNRVLHEKYVDQLYSREAKRKAACARAGKENRLQNNIQKIDVVRAAKNALVSDARDAIDKLKHLQTIANGNSSDPDDVVSDDEGDLL